ncbi:type VII secretion integral membrane protein EccD [Actinomycetospora termitidis]|uniref:Type VII secretion integral membrane protein EccD n=1 Tax=Actinomycetospora termitidis TaxID=3053470 RepID=A0ABT7M477_9PSEU|nr:type VII secretion integral membrane protein EccD [Actinomycetospora sp. Odt1-22]MDL5155469.1 type VII secretion integral membrane protein EccD [Actinomycetospora sp. Odt1-22]
MSTGNGRTTALQGAAAARPPSTTGPDVAPLPVPVEAAAPVTRVSVLAPTTRADLALPGDVPVGELLGVLVELTGADRARPPVTAWGRHAPVRSADRPGAGAWTLAPLGREPADPRSTLDDLEVLDGDQLVLRRRDDAAPAPLYDDVVDAVAESTPPGFRAWDATWAHRTGLVAGVVGAAALLGALLAAGRGPGTAGGLVTAVVAALVALTATVLAALAPRVARRPGPPAVLAGLGAAAAAVCGLAAVAGPDGAPLTVGLGGPHLLVASALALAASGTALLAAPRTDRIALAVDVALATAATLGTLVGAVTTVAGAVAGARGAGPVEPAAVAAGAGAAALVVLSALPRLAVLLARLPLPRVPVSPTDDGTDPEPGDPAVLDRRTDRAHALLSGLAGGTVAVLVAAVAVLGLAPAPGWRGTVGGILAVLLVVLAALRSRSYANAVPASVLLLGALTGAAGLAVGVVAAAPPGLPRLGVGLAAAVLGALAVLLGSVGPRRRWSPGARRAVDLAEGVAIAAVLPLACAVADLFAVVRVL